MSHARHLNSNTDQSFESWPLEPLATEFGDTIKAVLDARRSNSNTDQAYKRWSIELLAPQLACANKTNSSAINLMYAYAHAPIKE